MDWTALIASVVSSSQSVSSYETVSNGTSSMRTGGRQLLMEGTRAARRSASRWARSTRNHPLPQRSPVLECRAALSQRPDKEVVIPIQDQGLNLLCRLRVQRKSFRGRQSGESNRATQSTSVGWWARNLAGFTLRSRKSVAAPPCKGLESLPEPVNNQERPTLISHVPGCRPRRTRKRGCSEALWPMTDAYSSICSGEV